MQTEVAALHTGWPRNLYHKAPLSAFLDRKKLSLSRHSSSENSCNTKIKQFFSYYNRNKARSTHKNWLRSGSFVRFCSTCSPKTEKYTPAGKSFLRCKTDVVSLRTIAWTKAQNCHATINMVTLHNGNTARDSKGIIKRAMADLVDCEASQTVLGMHLISWILDKGKKRYDPSITFMNCSCIVRKVLV